MCWSTQTLFTDQVQPSLKPCQPPTSSSPASHILLDREQEQNQCPGPEQVSPFSWNNGIQQCSCQVPLEVAFNARNQKRNIWRDSKAVHMLNCAWVHLCTWLQSLLICIWVQLFTRSIQCRVIMCTQIVHTDSYLNMNPGTIIKMEMCTWVQLSVLGYSMMCEQS